MDVNERIQNMLSERIDTLETVIKTCVRQTGALESDLNIMRCRRLDEAEHEAVVEDARSRIREIVTVLEAATQ